MISIDSALSRLQATESKDLLEQYDSHISPIFEKLSLESDLQKKVNFCSNLQHQLFLPFVKRINTLDHFDSAYWRIADLTLPISREMDSYLQYKFPVIPQARGEHIHKVLWIIKGPFDLAHMDCVKNFLFGESLFKANTHNASEYFQSIHFLLFLDVPVPNVFKNRSNVVSFASKNGAFLKLYRLREMIHSSGIKTIIWPSVFQDHSLYMGIRHAEQQIFWSAKHRIQVLPSTIDQYFFGGFSKHVELYRGVEWKYGRYDLTPWYGLKRLHASEPSITDSNLDSLDLRRIKSNFRFLLGSCCVEQKYNSPSFWSVIDKILADQPRAAYCFTGRSLLPEVEKLLCQTRCRDRIFFVGWQKNINAYLAQLDLYLDAFPFGSGHVLYSAWRQLIPTISLVTFDNMRLSLMHSLKHIDDIFDGTTFSLPGICNSVEDYAEIAAKCINNSHFRSTVAAAQSKLAQNFMSNPVGMYEDFNSYICQSS